MLTINYITYTLPELNHLVAVKLHSADTPQWERDIYTFIQEWLNEKDCIVVNTSGSTGLPKPIELKKEWLIYSATQTCKFFNLTHQSTAILCLPAAYIAGKMMIVRAFVSGMNLITVEPTGNPLNNQSISKYVNQHYDFTAITPFQLAQSLESLKVNPTVKSIIVGGGEISHALENEIQSISVDIYATYGMTETSSHIALRKVNGRDRDDFYTVIGETEIDIDSRGCLVISNPNLFDGMLITNDIVEIINPKKFRWLGRFDNVINSGGIKIMPEEVESKIGNLRPETMIITEINDVSLGKAIVLVIETDEIIEKERLELLSRIKSLVGPYSCPKHIYAINSIPRTLNGKVNRLALKELIT